MKAMTLHGHGGSLTNTSFEELAQEELHDEAYPILGEPVADFPRSRSWC